ncbi:acyl transferase/acyl hydrolase/lysophospholipase [Sphaerosporella brunnea]|uniref:Acyl transferase/acyl hydrolase/lysophospholipase n=1 Tax=Sphaerosporella brunnea TaxID=1250544 RepID=A0A5J5F0A1_9PEZI|nr:acyl transferase/acyl hydrolase/lysophospholipase [Sphaerosporella brunnea]
MEGYDYNPQTGTYVRNRQSTNPPPIPPKEGFFKETYGTVELDGGGGEGSYAPPAKRRKVRILSLDGGGIRGYSTLVILGELMHQIYVTENNGRAPQSPADLPRPCDYFDLIGGNGTGGLIALMLGRMRMDVESCKQYYVSLTRFVFITDKTLLGMPYGKTLFKASRLEEAIKHCVRESTRFDSDKIVPHSPPPAGEGEKLVHRRSDSWRRRRSGSSGGTEERGRTGRPRRNIGNPDAPLVDTREGACKTFVTAMLEGSRKNAPPVLLRSYPSPAESMPSYKTTIWQAGRATCATAAAFKSITIDQLTFLDEGGGMYNPAFQVLDEAHLHEFPDCDIAAFVSVGTGKRPPAATAREEKREWWESVAFEGFAEAKRRLLRRIDDCERVHRELVDGLDGGRPKLAQGGVATQDYYRFNVEVGVGEFGMNEWNRLSEVATGTRRYLTQRETSKLVKECAAKLVAVERGSVDDGTKIRFRPSRNGSIDTPVPVEIPANHPYYLHQQKLHQQRQQQQQPQPQQQQQQQAAARHHQPQPAIIMPDEKIYTSPVSAAPPRPFPPPTRPSGPPPSHDPVPNNPYTTATPNTTKPPPTGHPALQQQQQHYKPQQHYTPQSPPPPPKPVKEGKVIEPGITSGDTPNPEIRVTSPTTVAGGSDNEDEEDMYRGYGRRRRRRRSRSRSLGAVDE